MCEKNFLNEISENASLELGDIFKPSKLEYVTTTGIGDINALMDFKVIYNIPYHSEFNPIEIVFSLLRKDLQDANVNNKEEIEKVILKFSKEINETKLTNIFNHSFKLLN